MDIQSIVLAMPAEDSARRESAPGKSSSIFTSALRKWAVSRGRWEESSLDLHSRHKYLLPRRTVFLPRRGKQKFHSQPLPTRRPLHLDLLVAESSGRSFPQTFSLELRGLLSLRAWWSKLVSLTGHRVARYKDIDITEKKTWKLNQMLTATLKSQQSQTSVVFMAAPVTFQPSLIKIVRIQIDLS